MSKRWTPPRAYSSQELESVRRQKGGYTRKRLEKLGVPWPPPKGWRKAILATGPTPEGSEGTAGGRKTHMRGCEEHDLVCFLNGAPSHWRTSTDWSEVTCGNCLKWLGSPRCYPCVS